MAAVRARLCRRRCPPPDGHEHARAESFRRIGIEAPKSILLYGPPGTGKTMLAKAVANESEANFITVKGSALLSKWYGESEKRVEEIFRKARQVAPSIIFLDELDALVPVRGGAAGEPHVTERVVNQLLSEIDGLEEHRGVVVIGATNRPDIFDPALLRPGRFDELIMVPVPDLESRQKIFQVHLKKMPLADDVNLKELVESTDQYTRKPREDLRHHNHEQLPSCNGRLAILSSDVSINRKSNSPVSSLLHKCKFLEA